MPTTGSGTGTQAAAPGATTAQALIDMAQTMLDDSVAAEFTEAELLLFLNEAIREYSQHLRRISTYSITTTTAKIYNLPWDLDDVLAVEYPANHNPARYLTRISYKNASYEHHQAYDLLHRLDLTQYPMLSLSFTPEAGETIIITYSHPHNHNLAATDACTVPADHHHVLLHYILYACARTQMNQEQANPTSSSSLLMGQLQANMRRLELVYLNALNRILTTHHARAVRVRWQLDSFDRIY